MGLVRGHRTACRVPRGDGSDRGRAVQPAAVYERPSGVVAVLDDVAPPLDGLDAQIVPAEPRASGPPPPLDLAHLPEDVRWRVPLRTQKGEFLMRGRTRWVPLDAAAAAGAGAVPWAAGLGLAVLVVAVAVALVLRARRAGPHASA